MSRLRTGAPVAEQAMSATWRSAHLDPTLRVSWLLRRAANVVDTGAEARLRRLAISAPQYEVLYLVADARGGASAVGVARALKVSPQNASALLGRLRGLGLVERGGRQPGNGAWHLSPAGVAVLADADAELDALEDDLRVHLGAGATGALRLFLLALRRVDGMDARKATRDGDR